MNARQRMWRQFRQKWLRDDGGAQVHEPPWTTPQRPLCIWPSRRKTRRIVFLSKELVYAHWSDLELELPADWLVLSRIGIPDEPQMALMADLHQRLRVPWFYIGDLDTLDLTAFLVMRALSIDFVGRRPVLPVTWLGINDPWLALCRRWCLPRGIPTLEMNPMEPEHWSVLRQVAPELPAIIGPECSKLLDSGQRLDLVGAMGGWYKRGFDRQLLKHLATSARTTRHP